MGMGIVWRSKLGLIRHGQFIRREALHPDFTVGVLFADEGAASGSCIRVPLTVKRPCSMTALGKFTVSLRLCAMVVFSCYLVAGASLVLPAELRCVRCTKFGAIGAAKSGASCPLSYHGNDCHNSRGKTAGRIILCPDGCMRHNGQSSEIPSLAKFLAISSANLPTRILIGSVPQEAPFTLLDPFLPQSYRPPSTPL